MHRKCSINVGCYSSESWRFYNIARNYVALDLSTILKSKRRGIGLSYGGTDKPEGPFDDDQSDKIWKEK